VNGGLASLVNSPTVTFQNGGLASLVNSDAVGVGTASGNKTAVIIDQTDVDQTNVNANNWLGNIFGINMITGLGPGDQRLVPGILVNPNFDITYGLGKVSIAEDNACLITHGAFKNFGSTPASATSLWVSMTTKVSGQLNTHGDYLLFRAGTISSSNITPAINNLAVPNGRIIADSNTTSPKTHYEAASNTWITKVPVNFSSTSDIFVTGAIINSNTGFKATSNSSTVMKGMFYCTKPFTDQWGYAIAAYQPILLPNYTDIDDEGQVISINGNYPNGSFRAGTPTTLQGTPINTIVTGGSGSGTGNNYTGSPSSFEKFTACQSSAASPLVSRASNLTREEVVQDVSSQGEIQILPNPATNYITLSFVPDRTGSSHVALFTVDGKKVFEMNNGICEAGVKYLKKIDVSKLISGVYMIQLRSTDKIISKKIVITR
jgi:hypothetical protein